MCLKVLLALSLWMLTAAPLAAQSKSLAIAGPGELSCEEVLRLSTDGTAKKAILAWTQGYLSGLNFYQMKTQKKFVNLGSLTEEAQFEICLSKCRERPEKKLYEAVMELGAMLPVENASAQ